jgi:hypothetical protein
MKDSFPSCIEERFHGSVSRKGKGISPKLIVLRGNMMINHVFLGRGGSYFEINLYGTSEISFTLWLFHAAMGNHHLQWENHHTSFVNGP